MAKINIYKVYFILALMVTPFLGQAGVIEGTVYDENDEPLPGTTIYVVENQWGSATNLEGKYKLDLEPGTYTVIYRFIGYETETRKLEVGAGWLTIDIKLKPRTIFLENVEVVAGSENAALAIMRRTIAKSGFHRNIVDSYTSRVYIKGKGKLNSIPFLLRKKLKEEGVDTSRLFIGETMTEIRYKRPNTYEEKVLSIRSTGDDNNSSPQDYITASFYEPEIVGTVSPLSSKAFYHYKFEYIKSYLDQGKTISRIKVIPRSIGDHLFEGEISIVEGDWALHSVNLQASKLGIKIDIDQVYQPFENMAWLPVSHTFTVTGSIVGIKFNYHYLASTRYSDVKINREISSDIKVLDVKKDKERVSELKNIDKTIKALESESSGTEMSTRELRKQMRAYEKEEQEEQEEPEVIISKSRSIDSLAYKRSTDYWEDIRSVPLTQVEVQGYRQVDSLAGNLEKDSTRKEPAVKLSHFLFGHTYRFNTRHHLKVHSLFNHLTFNTVEGVVAGYGLTHRYRKRINYDTPGATRISHNLFTTAEVKYSWARNRALPYIFTEYSFSKKGKSFDMEFGGGQRTYQLNREGPVHPLFNLAYTLLAELNYMKLYQATEAYAKFSRSYSSKFGIDLYSSIEERLPLQNQSDFLIIDWTNRDYSDNSPQNLDIADTSFPIHTHFFTKIDIRLRPFLKYRIYNGRKYPIRSTSPLVKLSLGKAWGVVGDTDYTSLSTSLSHSLDWDILADINLGAYYKTYLERDQLYFPDFLHSPGNQTFYSVGNDYRQLDYYNFSTDSYVLGFQTEFKFKRNMFISALPFLARKGVKDFAFGNFLKTGNLSSYIEVGYGLDYVFKVMKIEGVVSFIEGNYQSVGIRIGLAPELEF